MRVVDELEPEVSLEHAQVVYIKEEEEAANVVEKEGENEEENEDSLMDDLQEILPTFDGQQDKEPGAEVDQAAPPEPVFQSQVAGGDGELRLQAQKKKAGYKCLHCGLLLTRKYHLSRWDILRPFYDLKFLLLAKFEL